MKAVFQRKALLAAFSMVSGIVPSKSPRPILQNIKLVVDEDGSHVSATDLEVGVQRRLLGARPYEPGSVLLPTAKFGQILAACPDDEIDIASDGGQIMVSSRTARYKFASEDVSLYPEVPGFDAAAYHVVKSSDLRMLLRRCVIATDVDATRYALGGLLFEFSDDRLTVVGTDGRRLAKMICAADNENGVVATASHPVCPVKVIKLLDKTLDDPELNVHIAIKAGTSILFRTSDHGMTIYSRLVEGRFPKYQDVFPDECEVRIPLDVTLLRRAVEQASIVTSEESRGVDFRFASDTLTLSSQAADIGESQVTCPIHNPSKDVEITFDPRYLLDALKTIPDGSTINCELIDHKNAAVFKTEDGYEYVVMPLTKDR